jgi:regulator of nucleoside diphosphate kinase
LIFAGGISTVGLVSPASHAQIDMTAIYYHTRRGVFVPACAFVRQEPRVSGKVMSKPPITVSRIDLERIEALLERLPAAEADKLDALRAELDRADVVEPAAMPQHIVTMNSTVTFEDESNGEKLTLTLVYPAAAGAHGTVSILAPVGSALLGLARDQQIDWPTPDGRKRRLKVLEIAYQPEAAGHFHR